MFAPEILATIQQLANDFKEEIGQLRIIARDKAITAELGSGQSMGRGGSSWSHRTRWSRSTAMGNRLCQDRRLRERAGKF